MVLFIIVGLVIGMMFLLDNIEHTSSCWYI